MGNVKMVKRMLMRTLLPLLLASQGRGLTGARNMRARGSTKIPPGFQGQKKARSVTGHASRVYPSTTDRHLQAHHEVAMDDVEFIAGKDPTVDDGRPRMLTSSHPEDFYFEDDDAHLGISAVGGGKGGKGGRSKSTKSRSHDSKETKPSKSTKSSRSSGGSSSKSDGKGDNVFDHDEECYCDDRRRNLRDLGVGYVPCTCPPPPSPSSSVGSTSSKSSKSESSKGKGKGDSKSDSHSDDDYFIPREDDDDRHDNSEAHPARPPDHSNPTEPPPTFPNEMPASSPVTNDSDDDDDGDDDDDDDGDDDDGDGDGDGNGDGDGDGDDDDDDDDDGEDGTPGETPSRTSSPAESPDPPSGPAPIVTQPSERDPSPPPGAPTTAPETGPTSGGGVPPTPGSTRCQVADDGLFGTDLGLSEELGFQYQTLVIPSVTVAELNIDMLINIEESMGEGILTRVFPQCNDDAAIVESLTIDVEDGDLTSDVHLGTGSGGGSETTSDTRGFDDGSKRNLRRLQSGTSASPLDGLSIRPRDTVIEGLECINVEPVFPCFVIQGRITVFSEIKLDETTRELVQAAIRQSIETGNLENADNRFLGTSWRSFDDPQSEGETPGDGDGGDGSSGNGDGTTDTENGDGSGNGTQDQNGSQSTPPPGSKNGLEPWAIAIIAVGGLIIICCMVYLFLRRPSNGREKLGDDDGNESSRSEESHQTNSLADVYIEEDVATGAALDSVVPVDHPSIEGSIEEVEGGEEESSYDAENSREGLGTVPVTETNPDDSGGVSTSIEDSQDSRSSFDGPLSHEPMYDESTQSRNAQQQSHMTLDLEKAGVRDSLSVISHSEGDGTRGLQPFEQPAVYATGDVSDSVQSSYEEVVEDEYEIEYTESSDQLEGHQWEDEDVVSPTKTSLPFLAHDAQQSQSSFEAMRNKWEKSSAR